MQKPNQFEPSLDHTGSSSSSVPQPVHYQYQQSATYVEAVSQQDMVKFLSYVGYGCQAEAEEMLKINLRLVLASGKLVDCAKRTFENITGFQYAVWALDWRMWEMLRQYMSEEVIKEQLTGLWCGEWTKYHGFMVSQYNLISALKSYISYCNQWDYQQREIYWCQTIGGVQSTLPAHIIHEYCRKDRAFFPCPEFTDSASPILKTLLSASAAALIRACF